MTSMNNYLRMLLDQLNSLNEPTPQPQAAPVQPQPQPEQWTPIAQNGKVRLSMGRPQQVVIGEPQILPEPKVTIGQPEIMDDTTQAVMQTPNPNMPPMLPQSQVDEKGQPWSPGNPGYIGPFRESDPENTPGPEITIKVPAHMSEGVLKHILKNKPKASG